MLSLKRKNNTSFKLTRNAPRAQFWISVRNVRYMCIGIIITCNDIQGNCFVIYFLMVLFDINISSQLLFGWR